MMEVDDGEYAGNQKYKIVIMVTERPMLGTWAGDLRLQFVCKLVPSL